MKKLFITILAIAAVAALIIGFKNGKNDALNDPGNANNANSGANSDNTVAGASSTAPAADTVNGSTTGKKMAFDKFLGMDKQAYVCSVHQYVQDMDNVGTVYIGAAKSDKITERNIRGEFSVTVNKIQMDTAFIQKDGYTYSWSSLFPKQGFKIAISAEDSAANPGANAVKDNGGTYNWNASQIGDYDCKPWTEDASKFTLPQTVVFIEIKK